MVRAAVGLMPPSWHEDEPIFPEPRDIGVFTLLSNGFASGRSTLRDPGSTLAPKDHLSSGRAGVPLSSLTLLTLRGAQLSTFWKAREFLIEGQVILVLVSLNYTYPVSALSELVRGLHRLSDRLFPL